MRRRDFLGTALAAVTSAGRAAADLGSGPTGGEGRPGEFPSAPLGNLEWLIPQPQRLEPLHRSTPLASNGKAQAVIVLGENAGSLEQVVAEELRKDWAALGASLEVVREERLTHLPPGMETLVVLGTPTSNARIQAHMVELTGLENLGQEGYLIQPVRQESREMVLGVGNTPKGMKNAAMTLAQMAVETGGQVSLPLARITDYPDIPWRGVNKMLDYLFPDKLPSKSYVEGITNYRELLDAMMRVKFNTLVVHAANITWRVQSESVTSWERDSGAYKGPRYWAPKIQDIIGYAHARGIRVTLLLYHTLSGRGKVMVPGKDVCLTDPGNYQLLMEEFRSYLQTWPDLDAYIIHLSEFNRCTCETCQKVSPQEEFVKYLKAYREILHEHSPNTVMAYAAPPPDNYFWISKEHRDLLPKDIRNFIWADFFNFREVSPGKWEFIPGKTSFLLPLSETLEGKYDWFDDLPGHTWYWLYTNGYSDLRFPCPGYFKSRALASKVKKVEFVQGEFGYQRSAALNTLALASFSWNSDDDVARARKAALTGLYSRENLQILLPVQIAYEKLVQDYVAMIQTVGYNWRSPDAQWVDDLLKRVVSEVNRFSAQIHTAKLSSPLVAERLKGFRDDLAILKQEALIRQKLREAYLNYELYAPQLFGIRRQETLERTQDSVARFNEAYELNRGLVAMRAARATPMRPVKAHQEALEKLGPCLVAALKKIEMNRIPGRLEWEGVQTSFWSRNYSW